MALNCQLQNVRLENALAESKDTDIWNQTKVRDCIISAVVMARRLRPDDSVVKKLLARWPADSSVRYEWFWHLATRPEIKIPATERPAIDSIDNVYRVLARWLHLIDSNMDRTVIILHACGLSFEKIAEMFAHMRWKHNTLRRHHADILEELIYDLNHTEDLKWPKGVDFWDLDK